MPDNQTDQTPTGTDGTSANGAGSNGNGQGANGQSGNGAAAKPEFTPGRTLTLKPETWGKALQDERNKAKRAAVAERDTEAKALGFADHAAMVAHVQALKNGGAAKANAPANGQRQQQAAPTGNGAGDGGGTKRLMQENRRLLQENQAQKQEIERLRSELQQAKRGIRQEQRRRNLVEVRSSLEKAAVQAGVTDPDFAIQLLERQKENLTQQELDNFDEAKFFGELRSSRPYLFGESVRPATTGTGSPAGTGPGPGTVTRQAAASAQPDVKSMTPQQYKAHLASLGISPQSVDGRF